MNGTQIQRGVGIAAAVVMLAGCAPLSEVPTGTPTLTPRPTYAPGSVATLSASLIPTPAPSIPLPDPVPVSQDQLTALIPEYAIARLGIGTISSIQPSPDETLLAAVGDTGVHLFEMQSLAHIWSIPTERPAYSVSWSPDGNSLAVGLYDARTVIVLEAESGFVRFRTDTYVIPAGVAEIGGIVPSFSRDGHYLVTYGCVEVDDQNLCANLSIDVWDAQTGTMVRRLDSLWFYEPPLWLSDNQIIIFAMPTVIWDFQTDALSQIPDSMSGNAQSLSVDGSTFAVSQDDGIIAFVSWDSWSVQQVIDTQRDEQGMPYILSWSPDNTKLLVDGPDQYTANVIDLLTGQTLPLAAIDSSIGLYWGDHLIAWSPDGRHLVAEMAVILSGGLPVLRGSAIWDIQTGLLIKQIGFEDGELSDATYWLQDGTIVFNSRLAITRLNPQTGQTIARVASTRPASAVVWSPDGGTIVVGYLGEVALWSAETGEQTRSCDLPGYSQPMTTVEWLNNGSSRLAVTGHYGDAFTVNIETCEAILERTILEGELLSPDGNMLAYHYGRNWGVRSVSASQQTVTLGTRYPLDLSGPAAWSPDSTMLAIASIVEGESVVQVWDVASGTILYEQPTVGTHLNDIGLAWSPDGSRLATFEWTYDLNGPLRSRRYLRVHDVYYGVILYSRDISNATHCCGNAGLLWTADGRWIISGDGALGTGGEFLYDRSGSEYSVVHLWEAATGALYRVLRGHTSLIVDMALSPDGALLATASMDGTVILWDLSALLP